MIKFRFSKVKPAQASVVLGAFLVVAQFACSLLILPLMPGGYGFPGWYANFVLMIVTGIIGALIVAPFVLHSKMAAVGSAFLMLAILLSYFGLGNLAIQILLLVSLGLGGASFSSALLGRSFRYCNFYIVSIWTTVVLVGLGSISVIFRLALAAWPNIPDQVGFEFFFYSMIGGWVFLTIVALYSIAFWYFEMRGSG